MLECSRQDENIAWGWKRRKRSERMSKSPTRSIYAKKIGLPAFMICANSPDRAGIRQPLTRFIDENITTAQRRGLVVGYPFSGVVVILYKHFLHCSYFADLRQSH